MRIAIVSNYFVPRVGGNETNNRLVGEALVERGHDVTVFTRRYDSALPKSEIYNGIRIERLPPRKDGVVAKWLMNVALFLRIAFARPPYDVVLVTQCSAHILGPALASIVRRVPIVLQPIEAGELSGEISSRSLSQLGPGIRTLVSKLLSVTRRWAYRRAAFVVAFSSELAHDASAAGFPAESVGIIPNAVETQRYTPVDDAEKSTIRSLLGIQSSAQVVTSVGRLVRGKGLSTLIGAWAMVAPHHPDALLLIVGSGPGIDSEDDTERSLRAAVQSLGLQNSVRLTGQVSDVKDYLQASDLFAFTSEHEGFGLALVEAMSCGLPVVCTRIEGAAADVVVDGEHGLKFAVNDAAELAAAIRTLLADEVVRRRMADASRAVVSEKLSVNRIGEMYEQTFFRASSGNNDASVWRQDRKKFGDT